MTNKNPTTGIPYGIIRADAIDPDLWDSLCYTHGKDTHYDEALAAHLKQKEAEHEESGSEEPFDECYESQEFSDGYEQSEPVYAGQHEGVHYQTTWLGGGQLLWVFQSPVVTQCAVCSPCVPGAGNLDSHGEYLAYGVPATWLTTEFIEERVAESGFGAIRWNADTYVHGTNQQVSKKTFESRQEALEDCYTQRLQQLPGDSDATK